MKIAIVYGILASIATAANILAQDVTVRLYAGAFHLLASVAVGTLTGLVVKYVLDKRYIFAFRPRSAAHDGRTFVLYTVTGILTTAVFWAFEFGFDFVFEERLMRYLGAVLGLAIGYVLKYRLDQRYVFGRAAA